MLANNSVADSESPIDTTRLYELREVQVTHFYRSTTKTSDVIKRDFLIKSNRGQEPSFILNSQPSVFSYSDTGNEYGYSYFRMRGMDQTRINMTLDGMPLNEGEDMGVYFSNYPDFLGSIHTIKMEPGASISNNGVAGYAGSIDFESINLRKDTSTNLFVGYGSHNSSKVTIDYNMGIRNNWGLHIKANSQHSDGYRHNAYNNSQSLFVKTGYFINAKHSIDLISFVGMSKNGQAWIGSTKDEIQIDPRANGCTDDENDRFVQNINKIHYKGLITDNIIINASIYYNFLKGHYYFDVDNFMKRIVDSTWLNTGEIDCYHLMHHMYGGNVAAKFYLGDFNLTAGANISSFSRNHIGTSNLTENKLWNNTGYKNDINAFVKGEYSYKGLGIMLNAQYRYADFDYKGDMPFAKLNWNFFNWSAKVSYQLKNQHILYISATQTHREPTRSDMFGGEENFLGELLADKAESVIDYELGYNIHLNKLLANLNLYYMDFDNELILNGEYGTNGLPIRVGSTNSYRAGVELYIKYTPIKNLTLMNTTTYSINKVKTETEILNHVMSPTWLINNSVSYSIIGFDIGIDMKYRSDMYFELQNQFKLDSSLKFDAHLSYTTTNDITFGLSVNNVFNNRSFSNGMQGLNGPLYFIDSPRTFYGSIQWKF